MFLLPVVFVVYPDIADIVAKAEVDRDCKPYTIIGRLYLIPVLKLVFFELDIVQQDKDVNLVHLVKISEPGHELGLMDGNSHKKSLSAAKPQPKCLKCKMPKVTKVNGLLCSNRCENSK